MRITFFSKLVILFGLMFSLVIAQPTEPEQALQDAFDLYLNGQVTQGEEIFENLASTYRGTEVGYKALEFLVNHTDDERTVLFLQQIISDFPETRRQTRAQMQLLEFEFDQNPNKDAFLEGCDALVTSLNGPSFQQILDNVDSAELAAQIASLDEVTQLRLLEIYPTIAATLGENLFNIPGDDGNPEAEMDLLYFLHRVFTPLELGYDGLLPIYRSLPLAASSQLSASPAFQDPNVSFESPLPGEIVGPKPTLVATVTSGDFANRQVSLDGLEARLDGIDVKAQLEIKTSFNAPTLGEDFLTIEIVYTPGEPLSEGTHLFELDVPVSGYPGEGPGKTTAALNFAVQVLNEGASFAPTKDSTLISKHPHQNEGSNSLLTLEKIKGKATRTAVGFDLANQNLNGLTSATLVLSIDSDSGVNGWGNGDTIEAHPLNSDWVEGNGRSFGLKRRDQISGSGAGVTWFSPVDENISNDSANSVVTWSGGSTGPPTAPLVTVSNHQSGDIEFDVTNDILNGADSWLVRKTQENRGSKVSFYSKENGNPDLAPKLLLDYGTQTAANNPTQSKSLLATLGLPRSRPFSQPTDPKSELPTVREVLQQEPVAAFVGESLLATAAGENPLLSTATKVVYRAWLS